MNTMTLSPLQNTRIDDLKIFVSDGFDKMEEYIDNSFIAFEERFEKKIDKKFDHFNARITHLDTKIDKIDAKFDQVKKEIIDHVDTKIDKRISRAQNEIIRAIANK